MPRHIPYDPFRLVVGRIKLAEQKLFSGFIFRPERLFLSSCIVPDHLVRRLQDHFGGTVILLQPDHTRPRKRLFKAEYIFNIRPAEAVNRLIVIPHHTNISIFFCQKAHKAELDRIRILILVYHDITEPLLIVIQNLLADGKQLDRFHQKIVKIQRIILF